MSQPQESQNPHHKSFMEKLFTHHGSRHEENHQDDTVKDGPEPARNPGHKEGVKDKYEK
ncbi:hypothetical protein N7495_009740 [Penicillium taxi]|uniref:uncharacterized protein n=1 Tax=Penicillium taxi TaxID=168475 RepID=UPI00254575C6|nr:uncharacterized protein N7495_009740 [Penicillium taxi]KAJ5885230.1 hypothetical protein N7495_009740 [Penicillium taxi]